MNKKKIVVLGLATGLSIIVAIVVAMVSPKLYFILLKFIATLFVSLAAGIVFSLILLAAFYLGETKTDWKKIGVPFLIIVFIGGVGAGVWYLRHQFKPSLSVGREAEPEKKEVTIEAKPEKEVAAKKPQLPPRKEEAGPTFIKIRPGEVINLSQ